MGFRAWGSGVGCVGAVSCTPVTMWELPKIGGTLFWGSL